jgi:hypothetical protein
MSQTPQVQRTLRTALRFLLPLVVLAATPWLGVSGFAWAGFVTPVSLAARPQIDSFLDLISQADIGDIGAACSAGEFVPPSDFESNDLQVFHPSPFGTRAHGLDFAALPSSHGADCPSPPADSEPEATSQTPALISHPPHDTKAVVGFLFLETALRRPPPFPSRLFRPPRLPQMIVS